MRFEVIPKKPKDKYQVITLFNRVVGHIDFDMVSNQYQYKPLHDSKYTTKEMCEICEKMNQLNAEIVK